MSGWYSGLLDPAVCLALVRALTEWGLLVTVRVRLDDRENGGSCPG